MDTWYVEAAHPQLNSALKYVYYTEGTSAPASSSGSQWLTGCTLQVEWQGWRFHARPDPRTGYVVSIATYQQTGHAPRSVLYQSTLAEM
tara:strand:- start:256 stop:522 length:267 start_codon:yes stop_codon:yes gene_type:complete